MIYSKITILAFIVSCSFILASCGKSSDRLTDQTTSSTFYVDLPVKADGTTVVGNFSNIYASEKTYNLKACFKDNALNAPIQFLSFKVKAGNIELVKKTDIYGCIYWKEFISFDPRGADAYLKIDRTFEALDGHKGSVVVPMAVYPWDKGGKITISDLRTDLVGKDLTLLENTIEYSEIYSQSDTGSDNVIGMKVNAKVVEAFKLSQSGKSAEDINSILPTSKTFTLSFDRHDYSKYEVDSLLNLKIAHRFQFKMPISFLRSNMSEGIINESFFLGKVNVYLAVVSDQYDPITNKDISLFKRSLIASSMFQARIELGDIIGYTSLVYKTISSLPGRNYVIVTLESASPEIPFKNFSIAAQVVGLPAAKMAFFDYVNLSAKELYNYDQQEQMKNSTTSTALQRLAQTPNVVNLASQPKFKIPGNENILNSSFNDAKLSKELVTELCLQMLTSAAPSYIQKECIKKPSRFFSLTQREFIEGLNSKTPILVSNYFKVDTLTVNVAYAKNKSLTQTNASTIKGTIGLGINLGLNFGGKLGFDHTGKKNVTITEPSTETVAANEPKYDYTDIWNRGRSAGLNFGISANGGLGYDALWSRSVQNSKSRTVSVTAAQTLTLSGESANFEIDAKVKKCFISTLLPTALGRLELLKISPKELIYFCQSQVMNKKVTETYYLIHQSNGVVGSPFSDPVSSSQAPWRMFLRGNGVFNMFKTLVTYPGLEFVLEKMPEIDKLKNSFVSDIVDQEYPGLIDEGKLAQCKEPGLFDFKADEDCSW